LNNCWRRIIEAADMKNIIFPLLAVLTLSISSPAADVSAKISGVHLCCQSCVKGVEKAVAKADGVTATVDQDAETVTLTGSSKAAVQKAADALIAAGYYGKSSEAGIKMASGTGAKGHKVQTLKVAGVHLCCGKCVSTVDKALKSVPGVKEHTAKKNAESFEVNGDFNDKEVFAALEKAGLTGKIAK